MDSTQAIKHEVRHYVVRNVIATMGMSLYVIIDTLFISIAAGALGLTTLNLVLPLFNVFNGVGLLLGVGGATIFSLNKVLHPDRVKDLYSQLIIFAATFGIVLAILLNVFATPVVNFLGADDQTPSTCGSVPGPVPCTCVTTSPSTLSVTTGTRR